jgi:hypothetical protein
MFSRNISYLFSFLLCSILIPSVLFAQNGAERSKAFKTISISANYLQNNNRNMFHNYWKPANGLEIQGETEFYGWKVELGTQFFSVKAKNIEQPDFMAVNICIGWGLEQKISSKLFLNSSFTVGNYLMNFNDDDIDVNLKSESEFSFGIKAGFKYNIGKNMFINLSGRYQVIFTYHRIELSYISIGLGKTFTTPKWLRRFLN